MSKITFRADDDLIEDLETLDASKSEAMREALRTYLARNGSTDSTAASDTTDSLDALVAERVEAIVDERLASVFTPSQPRDINVNITLDGDSVDTDERDAEARKTPTSEAQTGSSARNTCDQCGDELGSEHVYCPNCGEKATHRVFCECGDELRSDWGFCPGCGRRTPAANVLDGS